MKYIMVDFSDKRWIHHKDPVTPKNQIKEIFEAIKISLVAIIILIIIS